MDCSETGVSRSAAGDDALDVGAPAACWSGSARTDRQPHVFCRWYVRVNSLRDQAGRRRCPRRRAAGCRPAQAAHQLRAGEGDLLGDQAAHRVADEVDRGQSERAGEGDRVAAVASIVRARSRWTTRRHCLLNKMTRGRGERRSGPVVVIQGAMKCWKNTTADVRGASRNGGRAKRIPPPSPYWVAPWSCVTKS